MYTQLSVTFCRLYLFVLHFHTSWSYLNLKKNETHSYRISLAHHILKGMSGFSWDCWYLSSLLQLSTWLYTCRITVNFGTLKDGSLLINSLINYKHLPKWCRRFGKNRWRLFVKKAQDFIWFGFSDDVHILLARATNTFKELQNAFQTSDVNICNGNMKYPNRNNNFSHWILRSRSSMFSITIANCRSQILFAIP